MEHDFFCSKRCAASSPVARKASTPICQFPKTKNNPTAPPERLQSPQPGLESRSKIKTKPKKGKKKKKTHISRAARRMEHDCRCNAFYKALTTTYENHTESQDILSELRLQDLEHRNLDYPVLDSSHKTCASCARNVSEILECTLFVTGLWRNCYWNCIQNIRLILLPSSEQIS